MAASVSSTEAEATSVTVSSVAGLRTMCVVVTRHILSKPRRSSQSVTAASNDSSSTSAMFV
jgi:hypothetical protein